MFSVLQGGVVVWAVGLLLRDVDVFAGEPAGGSGSCSLRSLMVRFCRWAGEHDGPSVEW